MSDLDNEKIQSAKRDIFIVIATVALFMWIAILFNGC